MLSDNITDEEVIALISKPLSQTTLIELVNTSTPERLDAIANCLNRLATNEPPRGRDYKQLATGFQSAAADKRDPMHNKWR